MAHRYYFLLRPPSIGTHPGGETSREAWQPIRLIPGSARKAHGWTEYSKPLDPYDIYRFDLYPAGAVDMQNYLAWRETNKR